ncbi:hypothetical protein E2C01_085253 [Portunus trituberculatus]|uniref:Uncharacterized protein n=1 Tax=Portunus trituberculatus TaxID=210409 RepID=A0A5B7J9Z2_PORTR|nr:hypothetical protein [Portunus trituberculatus]
MAGDARQRRSRPSLPLKDNRRSGCVEGRRQRQQRRRRRQPRQKYEVIPVVRARAATPAGG